MRRQTAFWLYMTSGLGAASADERISFDDRKPRPIEYAFDNVRDGGHRGGLRLQTNEASKIYIYEGNISDNDENAYLIASSAPNNKLELNLLGEHKIIYDHHKPYYDLRVIGEAPNKLRTDIRRIFYAPLYKGKHLLSANGNETNATPIAFSLDEQEWQKWVDNAGKPTNSGVQLSLTSGEYNVTDSNTTALIYYPKGLTLPISIPVSSNLKLDGGTVGEITYLSAFGGDLFYFYHKERNALAYGYFAAGDINLTLIDFNQTIDDPRP
jgi:hypothetical protein